MAETAHLLPAPMQLPTHGQKWSNMATQRLLTEQCFALSGRTICSPGNQSGSQQLMMWGTQCATDLAATAPSRQDAARLVSEPPEGIRASSSTDS